MAEPTIRPIREADVRQIHEIEKACFAMPWSEESILHDVKENVVARWLVLDDGNGGVLAYAGMWFVLDEAHVCNVAVRPDCRGKGYGKRIFTALIDLAKANSMAMDTISRLSVERLRNSSFSSTPNRPPSNNTPVLSSSGFTMVSKPPAPPRPIDDSATDIAME